MSLNSVKLKTGLCHPESLIRKNRISLKEKSHREDSPPDARQLISHPERILWQGIASHSRVRDVCGDLLRKRTFLRGNFDYTLGASVRNDLLSLEAASKDGNTSTFENEFSILYFFPSPKLRLPNHLKIQAWLLLLFRQYVLLCIFQL